MRIILHLVLKVAEYQIKAFGNKSLSRTPRTCQWLHYNFQILLGSLRFCEYFQLKTSFKIHERTVDLCALANCDGSCLFHFSGGQLMEEHADFDVTVFSAC
jgi:hypothetical protein